MVQVAVLGFGIVGSGTVEVLDKNADVITRNAGQQIKVKHILDIRDIDGPYKNLFVKSFEAIENDPDISVVAEVIGGVGAALDFTRRCLSAGKSVVTSNKELVAQHGYELLELARKNGVNYLFEASVGGGIPVIRPVAQCLSANKISEIYGILNGTTNYILSEMVKNGAAFDDALSDAQKKGYAEADPSADIEGHDACRKICILSSLAFGRHVYPDSVPAQGITGITADDVRFAGSLGYKIKLLGRARAIGGKVAAYVAPHLVAQSSILAGVDGVMNGIVVRGNAVGDIAFIGPGAGKMPTASAVVADIIDAVKHLHSRKLIGWENHKDVAADPDGLQSAWYVRSDTQRAKIQREFGEIMFAEGTSGGQEAFITAVMDAKKLTEILGRGVNALSCFRVLSDY